MGIEELISTLKKNEQKQIASIWQAAEKEAESLRGQVADAIAALTKEQADTLASACQKSMRAIFSATETQTREKKLLAYQVLDQALRDAAARQLPLLRQHDYENVFARLAAELPQRQWEKIVVNPADLDLAARFFSGGSIEADTAINGGLTAVTANGRIIVDNTFKKRLERKWLHVLPQITAALEKRYASARPAEKTG